MSDQLKHRLQNHEILPPQGAWNTIASELQEANTFLPVSRKMYDFELAPPEAAWLQIAASLKQDDGDARKAPVKRMNSLFLKLAAAAVLTGVIILGSLFLLRNTDGSKKQIASNIKDGLKQNLKSINLAASIRSLSPPPIPNSQRPQYLSSIENDDQFNDFTASRPLRKVAINDYFTEPQSISVPAKPIFNKNGQPIIYPKIVLSDDGEHIDITAPNGQQTRVSAKFVNVLLYMNANHEGDYSESDTWQKQFEEWRKKILQNNFIPSSTNYLDILELKELLTKDQQQ